MTKLTKPNWKAASAFLAALTGLNGEPVTWQVFPDYEGAKAKPDHWYSSLPENIRKRLSVLAVRGAGVFVTINKTNGTGRQDQDITGLRACAVDFDKVALPAAWPIEPHAIINTSPGKHHVWFFLAPGEDMARWPAVQAGLATFYGGDNIKDLPRVLRVPGFDHQKNPDKPFRIRTVKLENPPAFERYTLEQIAEAHGIDLEAAAAEAPAEPSVDIEWDTPANVAKARDYLTNLEATEGERNNVAFAAAAMLHDYAISPDLAREMLGAWNDNLPAPLPDAEIDHVMRSAPKYKKNAPGSRAEVEVDPLDEFEIETNAAGEKIKLPKIYKLTEINEHNVHKAFSVVNLGGKPRVCWWARSALDPMVRVPQFMSIPEFKLQLINKKFSRKVKTKDKDGNEVEETIQVSVANLFLNNKKRYTYDGVVLRAEVESSHPDSINLWRGYGFTPKAGDWSLLRDHILKVIADGKADRDRYIIRWIAWALQNADQPCEVALILKSAMHGTGKGFLLRVVRKLFGAHAMQISKAGLLTGRFTAHLAMTCFLFVDEMTLADNKESATLNSLLTEDVLAIEPKGVDVFMMPNHVKVAAASNQEHVALIAGSDRRFMVFEVSDKRARDIKYFKAIQAQLDSGGYAAMLHDLLEMELDGWHPRQTADVADDKNPEKVRSAAAEVEWLAGYLKSGVLDCQVEHRDGSLVYAGDFYEHARRAGRGLAGWSDYRFAKFLEEWGCERVRSNGSLWQFPPLLEMRAAFRNAHPYWHAFDDAQAWHSDTTADLEQTDPDFG